MILRDGTYRGAQLSPVDSGVKCNATMEADIDLLAKLPEEGLDRRSEAEAFARREVEGHGDFLDVLVVRGVEIVARDEWLGH